MITMNFFQDEEEEIKLEINVLRKVGTHTEVNHPHNPLVGTIFRRICH